MCSADQIAADVARALAEDLGSGDLTAALIPEAAAGTATVICREAAVICGTAWFNTVFAQLDPTVQIEWTVQDGARVPAKHILCRLTGSARALLSGERTALNFLQLLCGTASIARAYADALAGTNTRILDTRKTLPGLRAAQKFATRCGGCVNHRMGLYDAILIKENHITAAGSLTAAVHASRQHHPDTAIEVEVENLAQLEEALDVGVDHLLLDNFPLPELATAVLRTAGRAQLEASGNVAIADLPAIAATGVDFISVGALTKHVQAIDLSMRFEPLS
ncbi:carboxylating nicotinate-nucleotide diphosphorylase [Nitrococcus mobilis]|uniref:Probable nicotinate-nucleotide pyrophosphorylase [carboxylating] n=1 Tax=Nitrococcus mobilis Nb-231 TaxID=314278 RepID=A4BTA3_9GAMM|nr:carboxylating nicotinate-nucleotide diphosphorylase [Nitrococcus mobilis]EAR21005.1 nicotinate-nucleotide pyrophosphorylase [Nitrococcus mobilis Nb-231]